MKTIITNKPITQGLVKTISGAYGQPVQLVYKSSLSLMDRLHNLFA